MKQPIEWNKYKEEIISLHKEGNSSNQILDKLQLEHGDIFPNSSDRKIRKIISKNNTFENNLIENKFIPSDNWAYGWLKTEEASIFIKNNKDLFIQIEDIENAVKMAVENFKPLNLPKLKQTNNKALRGVISDAHIGMDTNIEDAMFGFEYGEDVFKRHLNMFFNSLKEKIDFYGSFDLIIIDDLGDGLDGFNEETTRGGHKLQQNMTNKQAWSAYVTNKLDTILKIINLNGASKYEFRNVCNDNHVGDWGWSANMAIKMVLEQTFNNVKYYVLNRPMEHFVYGKHTFILTHGKDKNLMMKNWSYHLTDKIANMIRQYIDHHNISTPYIHLDKGDLHKLAFDREPKFDYRSFMSFAPPSAWIQANFGVSYCGFSVQVIPKDTNEIQHTDVFFDLKKI